MLILYHAPRSRSSRFVWLLEEIAEPYEIAYVTIPRMDGGGAPDASNPHPDKKVPALVHDDELVTESAAIALYLSDAFPAKVGPAVGEPGRGAFLTWLAFYAGVMEPAITAKWRGQTDADPQAAAGYDAMERRLRAALATGPYLLGEAFSAADVLVSSGFHFARELMPMGAEFDAYLARIAARPAFQRAAAKDAP
ncbi:MAG: glutathione S-transferase family protein [Caulobacteraceae bacterium]|nr:glutathione S-transferase family protein [Caulobacteraceae bacterium]